MSTIKLYDYFRSSACYRVRIALNLKNLDYTLIPIHLLNQGGEQFSQAYSRLNPMHLVPTLLDQQNVLTQSMAIIEYLDEQYPSPQLLPNDPYHKARVRAFALSIVADTHPLNNLRVLTFLEEQFLITKAQKQTWYQHWIAMSLRALEIKLKENPSTHHFCFGETPTLADICLIPQLYNAKRFHCDLSPYPCLMRIDEHCQQLPAFTQAMPTH